MNAIQRLLTDHIDIWTTADTLKKSGRGRSSNNTASDYGIKKLRELILELAVHGKLVKQQPDDVPARELLTQININKSKLIADDRIKKNKSLPPINNDEKPFELPHTWEWVRFDDVCSYIQRGKGPQYVEHSDFIVVSQKCVRWSGLDITQARYINPDSINKYEKIRQLREGDILWNSTGTGTIGRACCVSKLEKDNIIVADSHVTVIRPIIILGLYMLRWIQSQTVQSKIEDLASGTTNQIELNTSTVISHPLPMPPLAEQHRIIAKIDELLMLCDQMESHHNNAAKAHEKLVNHLLNILSHSQNSEEFTENWQRIAKHFNILFNTETSIDSLKQTLFQLAVKGKLVPQDTNDEPSSELLKRIQAEKIKLISKGKIKKTKVTTPIIKNENLTDLPQGWEWCTFPDIGELARGKSKHRPRNDPKLYKDGTIPLIQTGDVARANGTITSYTTLYNKNGLEQSRLWPAGTMCITIAANIADSAILGFDACFPDSVVGFIPFLNEIDVRFYELFLRTAKNDLQNFAPSTAQKNINLEILGNIFIPVPPANEIHRIVSKVDEIMLLCEQVKIKINKANQLQQQLGDLVVKQFLAQ